MPAIFGKNTLAMNYLTALLLLLMPAIGLAQVHYPEVSHRYMASCGPTDIATIEKNIAFLDSLAGVGVGEGREQFLYDRGFSHYMRFAHSNDTADMRLAIDLHLEAWEGYSNLAALWNVGSFYFNLRECDEMRRYSEAFLEAAKTEEDFPVAFDELFYRYRFCCGE